MYARDGGGAGGALMIKYIFYFSHFKIILQDPFFVFFSSSLDLDLYLDLYLVHSVHADNYLPRSGCDALIPQYIYHSSKSFKA